MFDDKIHSQKSRDTVPLGKNINIRPEQLDRAAD
jgi:hypothetical protein